jgi:hypothetical protein
MEIGQVRRPTESREAPHTFLGRQRGLYRRL